MAINKTVTDVEKYKEIRTLLHYYCKECNIVAPLCLGPGRILNTALLSDSPMALLSIFLREIKKTCKGMLAQFYS
jgi:hypothetical protein